MSDSENIVKAPDLIALVYRLKMPCRQYSFGKIEDFKAWCTKHPYRNDELKVIAVKNREVVATDYMHAKDAVEYLTKALA